MIYELIGRMYILLQQMTSNLMLPSITFRMKLFMRSLAMITEGLSEGAEVPGQ